MRLRNQKSDRKTRCFISHDIRPPLTSISGNASNLLSHYRQFDDDTLRQIFNDIYDDCEWLIDLVENLLSISRMEYKLLCLLARNTGKVLTHTFITQSIWGRSWDRDTASLRVFIVTLRKKLESAPGSPQYIQTHIGIGYRMVRVE